MRGTAKRRTPHGTNRRITPACAGNSAPLFYRPYPKGDHPRVCGEQVDKFLSPGFLIGSPPRVRGTGPLLLKSELFPRITPACAGNSLAVLPHMRSSPDHPRVCGEQAMPARAWTIQGGSPPRVRGTDVRDLRASMAVRITPACAGNRKMRETGCIYR